MNILQVVIVYITRYMRLNYLPGVYSSLQHALGAEPPVGEATHSHSCAQFIIVFLLQPLSAPLHVLRHKTHPSITRLTGNVFLLFPAAQTFSHIAVTK